MSGINLARVVLGGVVAGLVINIGESIFNGWLFAANMEAAMARLNLPPVGGGAIAVFLVMGFALGIVTVWLYAAVRSRFGAGVSTALCAGAAVWFLAYVHPSIGFALMGLFPTRFIATSIVWGLGEVLLAAVAGAWMYHEAPAPASSR
jgi:hypothetical protein